MGTIVRIKPKAGAKIFGDRKFSGTLLDTKNKKHNHRGARPFTIPGHGVLLDLEKPADKVFYEVCMGPHVKHIFNKNAGFNYRYDIVNLEEDAKKYLVDDERKTELKAMIMGMKELELKTIGFFFNISGSESSIKAGLYRMVDDEKLRDKVGKFLLHPDRIGLQYIYHALSVGSQANKEGLYHDDKDLYFFNTSPIGVGADAVVAYIKGEDEGAISLYNVLKELYETAAKEKKKSGK